MYTAYLQVVSQLISSQQARVELEGYQVFIDVDPGTQKWTVSTPLTAEDQMIKDELFPAEGATRWQVKEQFLRREQGGSIMFFEHTRPLGRFIDFRAFFKDFLEKVDQFNAVFAS